MSFPKAISFQKFFFCVVLLTVLLGSCKLGKSLPQSRTFGGGFESSENHSNAVKNTVGINKDSLLTIKFQPHNYWFPDSIPTAKANIQYLKSLHPKKALTQPLFAKFRDIKNKIHFGNHPKSKNSEAMRGLLTFLFFLAIMVGIFLLLNHFLLHLTLQEILKGLLIIIIAVIVIALLGVLASY